MSLNNGAARRGRTVLARGGTALVRWTGRIRSWCRCSAGTARAGTADLIAELPSYVHLSDEHAAANASRKDSKFSQIVRNLKSHKSTKSNFIYQGFAQDVPGGFKITRKGLDFVREYFKN